MKKIITPILIGTAVLSALPAQAVCPVCIIAVGAGLGLSRYLGIDDTITGLWIGALTVSMIIWTINWVKPKIKKVKFITIANLFIIIAYYAMLAWPLTSQNFIGHPLNKIWGIDKIILGITLGSLIFFGTNKLYLWLKKNNNNHAYFPFQKVVMPLSILALISLIFYLLTR